MKLYIVRQDSNQIIGCFLNLNRARACVDKRIVHLKERETRYGRKIEKAVPLTTGLEGKLYAFRLLSKGVSSVNPDLPYSVYCVWIQQHQLNCSPLELLGDQA